jgi:HEAT repeat protein
MLLREFPNGVGTAMPALAKTLQDPDPNVRIITAQAMQRVDADAAKKAGAVTALIGLLRHPTDRIAWPAASVLREFPNGAEIAVAALAQAALQDPDAHVRLNSARMLHRLNAGAAKKAGAVTVLVQFLRHPDDLIAARAASALREFPDEAGVAVPALLEALRGTNTIVGGSAAWALEAFPKQADIIIPELRKAAERNDNVGGFAQETLKHFGLRTGGARRGENPKANPK